MPNSLQIETPITDELCSSIKQAADRVRHAALIDAFVPDLQKQLREMHGALTTLQHAVEKTPWIATQCSGVARKVIAALRSIQSFKVSTAPGIPAQLEAINEILVSLEQSKQEFRYGVHK